MNVLSFLLGLGIGLLLLVWQRSRLNTKLQRVLHELNSYTEESSLSSTSKLTMAVVRQQQVRQALERELKEYRRVLDIAPVGYLHVDDENRLVWCNTQAQRFLSLSPDTPLSPESGTAPRLLLELVRSYELDSLIEQTRDRQTHCRKDWTFYPVSPDPSQLYQQQSRVLRGLGFPLAENHVGIFLENRQEAVALMQQRDRWASDVAHELKTPLTSIRLVAETLQTRLELPLRGWVDRLINETIRLSTLVQDLLDLALLDREASQALRLKRTNLPELIHAAWLNVEPLARKKQLQLSYEGPTMLAIEVDEARIYRVLINLLDNSIKYSPPWQVIRVILKEDATEEDSNAPQVCLEVIDAGPGFPEAALPHVFERFFRADPARAHGSDPSGALPTFSRDSITKTLNPQPTPVGDRSDSQQRGSSGLGLAIVRQIVEAHGGSVFASNYPETGGAWLKVYLPLNQEGLRDEN